MPINPRIYTTPVASSIPFDNDDNGFASEDVQGAIEESQGSFTGKGFQSTFLGNGTIKNQWLENEDSDIQSCYTMDVFKYKARLMGIDFINQNANVDQIVLFALSDYGNGATLDRSYRWDLNNVRTAIKTDPVNGFIVNPGDKMALYGYDNGGDPFDLVISMDFIVLADTPSELSENFSEDYHFNQFPALASIPHIFA